MMEDKMTALIVAACAGWLAAGILSVIAAKKDNTDDVVEQVAATVEAGNAPILAQLDNVSMVLGDERLNRHCTKPESGIIDAQYLWCLTADCWQQQGAQGQTGSKTCGDLQGLADALTRCEMAPSTEIRDECLTKLVPR